MAKKVSGLREALKTVDALGRQMGRERTGDYNVALSASGAGQANLARQTSRLRASLTKNQAWQQKKIAASVADSRAEQKRVGQQVGENRAKYGSALGEAIAAAFAPAAATAAANVRVGEGMQKRAAQVGRIAGTVTGIAQAGVKAQGAAAEYAMAQALQQRTIVDNQTLAGLTGQLYQTAMEYNMQWQQWKRQQEYARKLAEEEAKKAGRQELRSTVDVLSETGPGVYSYLNGRDNLVMDDNGLINIGETVTKMTTALGLNPQDPRDIAQIQLATAMLRSMRAGDGIDVGVTDGLNALYSSMPGWNRYSTSLAETIMSGGGVLTTSRETAAIIAEQEAHPGEYRLTHPDGTVEWIPIPGYDGGTTTSGSSGTVGAGRNPIY